MKGEKEREGKKGKNGGMERTERKKEQKDTSKANKDKEENDERAMWMCKGVHEREGERERRQARKDTWTCSY